MLKQNLTRNISHLVSLYFTHGEVVRLGVGEVQSGDTGGGQHGQALGELYPSLLLHLHQPPHGDLLGVVRLDGVAGSWSDARVFDLQQVFILQTLSSKQGRIFYSSISSSTNLL